MILRAVCGFAAMLLFALPSEHAHAQRTVSLVVAYSAGGTTDTIARVIGARLSDKIGQPVVIENRAGATGQVGSRHVAKAAPDGLTLQIATQTTHAVAPTLHGDIGYDPLKDFTPISLVAWTPLVLVKHPGFAVDSVSDLIKHLKERPGAVNYATGGRGDGSHMAALFFSSMAKVSAVAVPFQGEGPAVPQLLGGHIPYMFLSAPTAAPLIEGNQVKALAVTSKVRSKILPNIMTMDEAGLKGFEMVNWWGIFGPPGMAPELVEKLNAALLAVLQEPETRTKLQSIGYEISGTSAKEFAEYVKAENVKWSAVIKEQGLSAK